MFGLTVLENYLLLKTKKWVYLEETRSYERYKLFRERMDKKGIDYRVKIIELSERERELLKKEKKELAKYCFQFYVRPGKRNSALFAIGFMPKSYGPFYCSAVCV